MKQREVAMKRGLTLVSRAVVYFIGFAVLSVCIILLPELAREESVASPASHRLIWPFLVYAWVLSAPIFLALHQTLNLLSYIDSNQAFSGRSVKALQNIKICAIIFGALIVAGVVSGLALARIVAPHEDLTPIVTLGLIAAFAASIVATFAAVLRRLLQDAIGIKSENDLTV